MVQNIRNVTLGYVRIDDRGVKLKLSDIRRLIKGKDVLLTKEYRYGWHFRLVSGLEINMQNETKTNVELVLPTVQIVPNLHMPQRAYTNIEW